MNTFKTAFDSWIRALSYEEKCYFAGGVAFCIFILLNTILPSSPLVSVSIYTVMLFLGAGVINYLMPYFQRVWGSIVGKFFLTIITFVGSTVCFSIAGQVINWSLGVSSLPFTYTLSVVALLVSPFIIFIFLLLAFVLLLMLMPLFFYDHTKFSLIEVGSTLVKKEPKAVRGILRVFGIIILITMLSALLENLFGYSEKIGEFTRWYAFNFEMQPKTHCLIDEGDRVAYLDSSLIVLGKHIDDEYLFKTVLCNLK